MTCRLHTYTDYPMRLTIALILSLLFSLTSPAKAAKKYEVRGVWLTTIGGLDWPHSYAQSERSALKQRRELCLLLDKLQKANINTVLLQTRIRATTIFPSSLEPWDGCLSGFPGRSPGYDALRFAVDECHKRGMELHAWVVVMPVGKWNAIGCQRLLKKYPKAIRKIGTEGFMNPERPETVAYMARFCREITDNYDVDGIHLDYIRYPETWPIKVSTEQGCANITRIVRAVSNAVKGSKPWVKVSCSPIGKYDDLPLHWSHGWNARTRTCQDAQAWLRDGIVDELFPMMYFRDEQFFPFALDWREQSCGRIVSVGLGVYMMDVREKNWDRSVIEREINVSRSLGMGHTLFRSKFFTDNTKGIYDYVRNEANPYPALVPPMTWQSKEKPPKPASLSVVRTSSCDRLTWHGEKDRGDGLYTLYNVYRSEKYPVNTDDARLLVAVKQRTTNITLPKTDGGKLWNYAVTAIDRYGNESEAAFTERQTEGNANVTPIPDNGLPRSLWRIISKRHGENNTRH